MLVCLLTLSLGWAGCSDNNHDTKRLKLEGTWATSGGATYTLAGNVLTVDDGQTATYRCATTDNTIRLLSGDIEGVSTFYYRLRGNELSIYLSSDDYANDRPVLTATKTAGSGGNIHSNPLVGRWVEMVSSGSGDVATVIQMNGDQTGIQTDVEGQSSYHFTWQSNGPRIEVKLNGTGQTETSYSRIEGNYLYMYETELDYYSNDYYQIFRRADDQGGNDPSGEPTVTDPSTVAGSWQEVVAPGDGQPLTLVLKAGGTGWQTYPSEGETFHFTWRSDGPCVEVKSSEGPQFKDYFRLKGNNLYMYETEEDYARDDAYVVYKRA